MKSVLLSLSALLISVSLVLPQPAEAKRFGGGSSLGQQKSMPAQQRQQTPPAQQQAAPARQAAPAAGAAAASGSSKWLGPLAGLAAGGVLAWMIFGEGFEGIQIMDILLFALIAFGLFMLFRAFARRQHSADYATPQPMQQPVQQRETSGYNASGAVPSHNPASATSTQTGSVTGSIIGSGLGLNALHNVTAPSWFDEASFIESAKHHFVAVQKAWDANDAAEIESYCTPALYAELKNLMAQLTEENHTEVDTLYAEIADQSFEADYFIVSVRFSGFIKEGRDQEAHAFNEIWHIRRLAAGEGNWEIAGIQQHS